MTVLPEDRTRSTHKTEVVRIEDVTPHPNADSLDVVKLWGYTCVVKRDSFPKGSLAAYVVPDSLCDTSRPEFAFLAPRANASGLVRVKATKLRGLWSEGLLVPAPPGSSEGEDVAALLGVTRYEPPLPGSPGNGPSLITGGETARSPSGHWPVYGLETFKRFGHLLQEGEEVVCSEKIHGTNARYLFLDGTMYCGSREHWKKEYPTYDHLKVDSLAAQLCKRRPHEPDDSPVTREGLARQDAREIIDRLKSKPVKKNLWWRVLDVQPEVLHWCQAHPGLCLYGEVAGQVQDLRYGSTGDQIFFRVFDVWDGTRFLDFEDYLGVLDNPNSPPLVPHLYRGPYSDAKVRELTDGPSTFPGADHCREGVVVRPVLERWDPKCGRVVLKSVSNDYLSRKEVSPHA